MRLLSDAPSLVIPRGNETRAAHDIKPSVPPPMAGWSVEQQSLLMSTDVYCDHSDTRTCGASSKMCTRTKPSSLLFKRANTQENSRDVKWLKTGLSTLELFAKKYPKIKNGGKQAETQRS